MANNIERVFAREGSLAGANGRGSANVPIDTEFVLNGNYAVENGWKDQNGEVHNEERSYAYFGGTRKAKNREAETPKGGISASTFMRKPRIGGWSKDQLAELTDFSKRLADCMDADDLDRLFQEFGIYAKQPDGTFASTGKKVVCVKWVYNNEVPYGQKEAKDLPYSVFDVK